MAYGMGKGGGADSSGPGGLGASGGGDRSKGFMEKTGISVSPSKTAINKQAQMEAMYDAFDPKGQYDHNPHLDSFEPGTHNVGNLNYEQAYRQGLISQKEYNYHNMVTNQNMPIGKNYDIEAHKNNMPTIDDVDQTNTGYQKMSAMKGVNVSPKGRNVGYRGLPKDKSETMDDPLIKASLDYIRTASKMEDSTETAIKQIEALRKDTLRKVEY
jgi:hypothetical protein